VEFITGTLSTIAIFIAALFVLVLVHELGHFLTAKFFKMRVDRFSIGFPPKLIGNKIGDTEYVIGATPLGGYVKIAGMIDESMDTDYLDSEPKDDEFRSKPVWQRMIVISAGVIFNMILAVVIYAGLSFSYGQQKVPLKNVGAIYMPDSSLVGDVGFRTGDKLLGVNKEEVEFFDDLRSPSVITSGNLSYIVSRGDSVVTITMPEGFLDRLNKEPFLDLSLALPSRIGEIAQETPADSSALKKGDNIVAINGKEVKYWIEMAETIQESEGPLNLTVLRNRDTLQMSILPNPETKQIGVAPVNPVEYFDAITLKPGMIESVKMGFDRTEDMLVGITQSLVQLVAGDVSVRENLGGPVAIASATKSFTDRAGFQGFWLITAMLSITLAIMNILPIPVLDGGHLVFLIYEGVTRREPSPKVRMILQQIGFVLLIGLMIFATFNDILRLL